MGSTITNNRENLVCKMKGEREILASAARSLWCQDMLMNIVYVVSNEWRESFVSSMSNECKCIVV